MAYGLMTKDQFVDIVAKYAHDKDLNEEKMTALVENLFEELEISFKRRQADQIFEAHIKRQAAAEPESQRGMGDAAYFDHANSAQTTALTEEIKSLRKTVQELADQLKNIQKTV